MQNSKAPAKTPQLSTKHEDLKDELGRQYSILMKDAPVRLVTTLLAYGLAGQFLPMWITLTCCAVNLGGEIVSALALKDLDPAKEPARYRYCLIWVFILELAFSIVPAALWHVDGPYMKAFAVGLAVTGIMHVSTVRAIHLPMAITGFAAIAVAALGTNAILWIGKGDIASLAFTTVCAIAGLSYALGAIISNNKLHCDTASGRAEAQAANAAKGTFLAQMSHELRTPLNAILGMGHAELRRTKDPVSLERLSVLISSAEGLSTILDDILDMSAIQGGHLPIRRDALSIRTEISATAALFRPQIDEAGLTLTLDLPDSLPDWAMLDAQRLRQCLSNLLSNAVKNTAQGGITITASRSRGKDGAPLLRIKVADTGPGIAPEIADAMFEPFTRGPGTSLGTGLGLSITRALARQMGGDLRLEQPEPGPPTGAQFVLSLGLQEASAQQTRIATAPAPLINLAGIRVLVVDDITSNRLVASTYLRIFGADPVEAASGAAALHCLASEPFDLVLLDMNMPEMDGLETLSGLRRLPHPAGTTPVIAMTANTTPKDRQRYADVGINGYIAKPVAPDVAAAEIARVLRHDRATADSPQVPIAT
jgi:signal transduction histidine kinase/CheY-like chemotaxis protein